MTTLNYTVSRYRQSVARTAWAQRRCLGVVTSLSSLASLGAGALAQEVVTSLVGGVGEEARHLATAAPLYLCSQARTVCLTLTTVQGRPSLTPTCSICSSGPHLTRPRTPNKGVSVSTVQQRPSLF